MESYIVYFPDTDSISEILTLQKLIPGEEYSLRAAGGNLEVLAVCLDVLL